MSGETPRTPGAGVAAAAAASEQTQVNYDESQVRSYELPDPLQMADGILVTDASLWRRRRQELLNFFSDHVYGRTPQVPVAVQAEVLERSDEALDGLARREQVRLWLGPGVGNDPAQPHIDVLIYVPAAATGPVPAWLGLNFLGNHATIADPHVLLPTGWVPRRPGLGVSDHKATEADRGVNARRWPVASVLRRGQALVTAYCGDIDPDFHDGFRNGVHPLLEAAPEPRPDHAWGTIGAWAWGLSRILDYLEEVPAVDARRVAVLGHSRLGKTALWAGAQDERFALVVSNNSGCGGAALTRRNYGENLERINHNFPHWFAPRLRQYVNREAMLPVDQHELIALIAPRPVYVASATEDLWADPRGEFLSAWHAGTVYEMLGHAALPSAAFPEPDCSLQGRVGYHRRTGRHDVLAADWEHFLDFADRHGF